MSCFCSVLVQKHTFKVSVWLAKKLFYDTMPSVTPDYIISSDIHHSGRTEHTTANNIYHSVVTDYITANDIHHSGATECITAHEIHHSRATECITANDMYHSGVTDYTISHNLYQSIVTEEIRASASTASSETVFCNSVTCCIQHSRYLDPAKVFLHSALSCVSCLTSRVYSSPPYFNIPNRCRKTIGAIQ